MRADYYLFYYPFLLFAVANCLIALLSPRLRRATTIASVALIGFFLLNIFWIDFPQGADFEIFRNAGLSVQHGRNPYDDPQFVSPPTSLPLFLLFSMADYAAGNFAWTLLNVAMVLSIAPLTQYLFMRKWTWANFIDGLPLTALIALAIPTFWGLGLGQLALLQAFVLVLALISRDAGRFLGAGAALALATLKPQTALPFLIPFAHWRYFRVGLVAALCMAAMIFFIRPPATLIADLQLNLQNIAALSRPDAINDYSFTSPFNHTIVSLQYLFYCLGLKDRDAVQVAAIVALLAIGLSIWGAWIRKRIDDETMIVLTACFAMLFLYHRISDATILILPFVYLWREIRRTSGRERKLFLASFLSLLPIWFVHAKAVDVVVAKLPPALPWLRYLGEALLMPYATWSLLLAGAFILAASSVRKARDVTWKPAGMDRAPRPSWTSGSAEPLAEHPAER